MVTDINDELVALRGGFTDDPLETFLNNWKRGLFRNDIVGDYTRDAMGLAFDVARALAAAEAVRAFLHWGSWQLEETVIGGDQRIVEETWDEWWSDEDRIRASEGFTAVTTERIPELHHVSLHQAPDVLTGMLGGGVDIATRSASTFGVIFRRNQI